MTDADDRGIVAEPALVWTREKPLCYGYYWLNTPGYARTIIVWVFHAVDGALFVDRPIVRYVAAVEGWWAGPLPEPTWPEDGA